MFRICTFEKEMVATINSYQNKTLDVFANIVSFEETISVKIRSVQT